MIIKEISSFVAVDEIVIEDSSKYLHFVTHLDHCLNVPDKWDSIIYTSRHVAKVLTLKKFPIPRKYFRIIEPDEEYQLILRDGEAIKVRMFTNDGFNGNVMFYFQCRNGSQTSALYTGPFIRYRSILLNDHFRNCVLAGIDHLYVDNTRAHSTDNETIQTVGCKVRDILQKYPDYIIMLNIPPFGYEDLIFSLVKDFGLKIFGGELQVLIFKLSKLENIYVSNVMDAEIVIGEEAVTLEKIKYRFLRKRITMRFCESNFTPKYNDFEKIGYFQIHWTPHPSLVQLYAFIDFVKPHSVREIYDDMPNLPIFLTSLCRKKTIENCAADAVVENIAENQASIENSSTGLNAGLESLIYNTRIQGSPEIVFDESENYTCSTYLRRQTELPRNLARERIVKKSLLRKIAVIRPNNAIATLPPLPEQVDENPIVSQNESVIAVSASTLEMSENETWEHIFSGSELSSDISLDTESAECGWMEENLNEITSSQSECFSPVIVFNEESQQSFGESHLYERNNDRLVRQPHCIAGERSTPFSINNTSPLSSQTRQHDNSSRTKKCNKRIRDKLKSLRGERNFSRLNESSRLNRDSGLLSCEPIEIFSDNSTTPPPSRSNKLSKKRRINDETQKLRQTATVSCHIQTKKATNLFSKKPQRILYSSDEE